MALLMLALLLAAELRSSSAVITCPTVRESVQPCVHFVKGNGYLTSQCCDGVKRLIAAAKASSDRKSVCSSLQEILTPKFRGLQPGVINGIAKGCHVQLPNWVYSIMNTDCSKVN
ncbi:hypothetical protein J5N97_003780 [Dioscorea zingiberensis]|uniref:Bifunctional inhibitor/plant lipid transfer protein/seed storage helical domain-containing protein n=1 Tax=Dioscorea zingiberensis TaxID=325984 RepID=A0A9D5D642_9LILI|nr:hypothetical protein J5N97_003780 [Dioscorea zingiberensis]